MNRMIICLIKSEDGLCCVNMSIDQVEPCKAKGWEIWHLGYALPSTMPGVLFTLDAVPQPFASNLDGLKL